MLFLTLLSAIFISLCSGDISTPMVLWSTSYLKSSIISDDLNLQDVLCLFKPHCKSDIAEDYGLEHIKPAVIVTYLVHNDYDLDDLNNFETNDYNSVRLLSVNNINEFAPHIHEWTSSHKHNLFVSNIEELVELYQERDHMVVFEIDNIEFARNLYKSVDNFLSQFSQNRNIIHILGPNLIKKNESEALTIEQPMAKYAIKSSRLAKRKLLADNCSYCLQYSTQCVFSTGTGNSTCVDQYELFGWFITAFLLFPFACCGICCMNMIETPLRFPTRILPVRKEY